eukprot:TRINITY_DN1080_c0_g2_i4.p1 TRINITY_DN1080_c0_g2~~TRINITY_DN1080_c0_g2_i4.p1  ORF type:complete len:138 (+),score=28.41 TRINITY_DN1080_c0_g2_i4:133-546(+)
MEELKGAVDFNVLDKYKNLINIEVSKYPHFNLAGPEPEPFFDNVIWVQIPSHWTVEEIAKLAEDYGDTHIVKDSLSSAYIEFKTIYKSAGTIEKIVEGINGKGVKACMHKDARKYKAGPALNTVEIAFVDANTVPLN